MSGISQIFGCISLVIFALAALNGLAELEATDALLYKIKKRIDTTFKCGGSKKFLNKRFILTKIGLGLGLGLGIASIVLS